MMKLLQVETETGRSNQIDFFYKYKEKDNTSANDQVLDYSYSMVITIWVD